MPGDEERPAADAAGEDAGDGATIAGIAVHGRVRRPDWNGLRPWTTWKNWTRRNTAPKTPKYMRNETGWRR